MNKKIKAIITGSTGMVGDDDPQFAAVIADWLNELERIHLILRTSPKLRERHGD